MRKVCPARELFDNSVMENFSSFEVRTFISEKSDSMEHFDRIDRYIDYYNNDRIKLTERNEPRIPNSFLLSRNYLSNL